VDGESGRADRRPGGREPVQEGRELRRGEIVPTQEKVESVEDLKRRLSGVKTVLLAEYRGLTVQQLSDLRKQLRSVSAEYKVVKNRLAERARSGKLAGRR